MTSPRDTDAREALAARFEGTVVPRNNGRLACDMTELERDLIVASLRRQPAAPGGEPDGWRYRVKGQTPWIYDDTIKNGNDPRVIDRVVFEAGPFFLSPPPSDDRAKVVEEAAKIVDAECERILSKQTPTSDPLSMTDTVNGNLRMMAFILPDIAKAIRALSPSTPPTESELRQATGRCSPAESVPERETFWLLERHDGGAWALYTSHSGVFVHSYTEDVWQAGRFQSERHAHDVWRALDESERERWKPVEHMFINKVQPLPAPPALTDKRPPMQEEGK